MNPNLIVKEQILKDTPEEVTCDDTTTDHYWSSVGRVFVLYVQEVWGQTLAGSHQNLKICSTKDSAFRK